MKLGRAAADEESKREGDPDPKRLHVDVPTAPVLLVVAHVLLALLVFEPTLFPGADAGHYMVLGEAIRSGAGFRDIQLPGSPLHAKFPPGYPAILAVAGWFGGLQLFKLLSLAFTSACVWLTYRIAEAFTDRKGAIVAATLLAVSPVFLDFSHRVLSEAAFTLLVLATVVATLGDRKLGAVALAAAAAAFFTRTAGLAVLVGLVVWTLLSRDRRGTAVALVVAVGCVVGWAVYQRLAQPMQPGYLQQLVQENPYLPEAGTVGMADFPVRAARNMWRYASSELPGSFGFATTRSGTILSTALAGVVLSTACLIGWLKSAGERIRPTHLILAVYVALILLWPPVWTDRRFLLPVLPLLLVFGVVGGQAVAAKLPRPAGLGVIALLVGAVAGGSLHMEASLIPSRVACQSAYRAGSPCDLPQYREFYAMGRWAAENTPPGSVIVNRSPATFFLFSRRQGDLYPYSTDPEIVLRGLDEMGADYVLVDRLSATTNLYLVPAITANLDRFEVVHTEGGASGTVLLRVLPTPRTASRSLP